MRFFMPPASGTKNVHGFSCRQSAVPKTYAIFHAASQRYQKRTRFFMPPVSGTKNVRGFSCRQSAGPKTYAIFHAASQRDQKRMRFFSDPGSVASQAYNKKAVSRRTGIQLSYISLLPLRLLRFLPGFPEWNGAIKTHMLRG
jgi:hypothetical protein